MCFSSPHVDNTIQQQQLAESQAAREKEAAREARIQQGTQAIDNQFSQFDDSFYNKRAQAYTDYYQPQLDDRFSEARKDLTYALARAGTLNSTAAADKNALLQKQYATETGNIQAKAQGEADNLRTTVQNNKSGLVSELNSTGDADAASNAALASTKQMFNQVPAYNSLGDIFSGFSAGVGNAAQQYASRQILAAGGVSTKGANYNSSQDIP